jgi:hypothetical protein
MSFLVNSVSANRNLLENGLNGEEEWRTHPYLAQGTINNLPIPHLDFMDEIFKEEDCNAIRTY